MKYLSRLTIDVFVGLSTIAGFFYINPYGVKEEFEQRVHLLVIFAFIWILYSMYANRRAKRSNIFLTFVLILLVGLLINIYSPVYQNSLAVDSPIPEKTFLKLKKAFPNWPFGKIKQMRYRKIYNEEDATKFLEQSRFQMLAWQDPETMQSKITTREDYRDKRFHSKFKGAIIHFPVHLYVEKEPLSKMELSLLFRAIKNYNSGDYKKTVRQLEDLPSDNYMAQYFKALAQLKEETKTGLSPDYPSAREAFKRLTEFTEGVNEPENRRYLGLAHYYLAYIAAEQKALRATVEAHFDHAEDYYEHPMLLLNRSLYDCKTNHTISARYNIERAIKIAQSKKREYLPFCHFMEGVIFCYQGDSAQSKDIIDRLQRQDHFNMDFFEHPFIQQLCGDLRTVGCLSSIPL